MQSSAVRRLDVGFVDIVRRVHFRRALSALQRHGENRIPLLVIIVTVAAAEGEGPGPGLVYTKQLRDNQAALPV